MNRKKLLDTPGICPTGACCPKGECCRLRLINKPQYCSGFMMVYGLCRVKSKITKSCNQEVAKSLHAPKFPHVLPSDFPQAAPPSASGGTACVWRNGMRGFAASGGSSICVSQEGLQRSDSDLQWSRAMDLWIHPQQAVRQVLAALCKTLSDVCLGCSRPLWLQKGEALYGSPLLVFRVHRPRTRQPQVRGFPGRVPWLGLQVNTL